MIPFQPGFQPVSPLFPGGPRNLPAQFNCDADRVVQAGGALGTRLVHPDVRPFQYTFRKAASEGLYTASRQKPYQFVLGAYTVPMGTKLALASIVFQPFRFDGLIAGEAVPLEDRRLSLSIGYDVTLATTTRPGVLQVEMLPAKPSILEGPAFPNLLSGGISFPALPTRSSSGETPPEFQFNTAYGPVTQQALSQSANQTGVKPQQFITTAAAGGALLPQTQEPKQGPADMPFTYYVNEGESVALSVVAFNRVRIPIAFFEGTIAGYLLPKTTLDALLDRMRPCST